MSRAAMALAPPQKRLRAPRLQAVPAKAESTTVTQDRLKRFYEVQNDFYEVRRRYIAEYDKLQDMVLHGAEIRTGLYKLAPKARSVRRPKYKQIVIDLRGKQYQQKILEETEPTIHFRIRVE